MSHRQPDLHSGAQFLGAVLTTASILWADTEGPPGAPPRGTTDSARPAAAVPLAPSRLTLQEALKFAREHHPDLQVARAAVQVVRADSVSAAVRPFNPELEIGMARGGESLASGDEGSLDVGIQQEVELWGKRRKRRALAAARLRTAQAELEARQQQVEAHVRARFQAALFLQRRLGSLGELSAQERQVVTSTQARVRDESVTPLTGRLTELDWLRIGAVELRAQADYRLAVVGLSLALGGSLVEPLDLVGEVDVDTLAAPEDTVVALALARRRETQVILLRVDESRAELRLARVAGRPNLGAFAGLVRERSSLGAGDFSGNPAIVGGITGASDVDHLWQARLTLPLPFWQRNQGEQARAAAQIEQARLEQDRFTIQTGTEIRAAVRAFQDAARLYRLYLERASRVREDLRLVRAAYMDGRIALESYLTQKGRLVDTLLDQLEAEDRYWETRGALELATATDLATIGLGGSR